MAALQFRRCIQRHEECSQLFIPTESHRFQGCTYCAPNFQIEYLTLCNPKRYETAGRLSSYKFILVLIKLYDLEFFT